MLFFLSRVKQYPYGSEEGHCFTNMFRRIPVCKFTYFDRISRHVVSNEIPIEISDTGGVVVVNSSDVVEVSTYNPASKP